MTLTGSPSRCSGPRHGPRRCRWTRGRKTATSSSRSICPASNVDSIGLDIERNVLTVRAERRDPTQPNVELTVSERPRGIFSRQLILGDTLDTEHVKAHYADGVLTVRIPVAEQAKPRKIEISHTQEKMHEIAK